MGFRFEGTGMGSSSGSDMLLVSGEMFEGLLKDRQFVKKVRTFVVSEEGRGTGGGTGGSTGRVSSSRIIEESSQSEMEIDEEVRDRRIESGETRCELCQREFETTRAFKNHFRKMHQGKVRFMCNKCTKGFNTRIGMENHKNKCMEGEMGPTDVLTGETKTYATLQCETCNKKFVCKSSLKKHVKVFHEPKADYPCQFMQVLQRHMLAIQRQTSSST